MGDTMSVKQAKAKIYSVSVGLHQLNRIIEHGVLAEADRLTLLEAIAKSTIGLSMILSTLPDSIVLDCPLSGLEDVILVKDEEEAEKITEQEMGLVPKPGEYTH